MLVDDQAMVRHGLRLILESEPDITVVGEAGDGIEAVELAERANADVVLMDVRMPRRDGIAACAEICRRDDAPAVLMLTTFDLEDYVYAALRAGASGFLLKDAPAEQLIEAIHNVARGDAQLAPSITRLLIAELASRPVVADHRHLLHELTERDRRAQADGPLACPTPRSRASWILGEATIKTHVGRVLAKLGARDRVQAVVTAYESGSCSRAPPDTASPAASISWRPGDQHLPPSDAICRQRRSDASVNRRRRGARSRSRSAVDPRSTSGMTALSHPSGWLVPMTDLAFTRQRRRSPPAVVSLLVPPTPSSATARATTRCMRSTTSR